MPSRRYSVRREHEAVALPIWQEMLVGVELAYLHASPVYWGFGVPHGDGAPVVTVPGFMCTDAYLAHFRKWLRRIGYQTYSSGVGLNADCPNLLIRERLTRTLEQAWQETGRKAHVIGHSLGGLLARASAAQRPDRVASVITLGSPFRGTVMHSSLVRAAEIVRGQILERHAERVLPDCYTGMCTCRFMDSLSRNFPASVRQTAIYSKADGIVDWRFCITGDASIDCEASSTHIGMIFNPIVYQLIAQRLAGGAG